MQTDFESAANTIVTVGQRLNARGLAPATSGNYSIRLGDGTVAITVSGAHKGYLTPQQIMRVDAAGTSLDGKRPSAETLLHCAIYQLDPTAGAVLHTHSVPGVVLSRVLTRNRAIRFSGYEMQKAYPGIRTHATDLDLPIVENTQDMKAMAAELPGVLQSQTPPVPAFYIREHGLYAWGPSMAAAENIVEASEYLLACEWELLKLQGRPG